MKTNTELDRLRSMIDGIDDRILDLIERRLDAAREIAAAKSDDPTALKLCPAREAEVIGRLEARASATAAPAVRHVWRELMAHSLQLQARTDIVIASGDDALRAAVRHSLGSAPSLIRAATEAEALALAARGGAIAVLAQPLPPLPQGLGVLKEVLDEAGTAVAAAIGRLAARAELAWSPGSWRSRKAAQMPIYPSAAKLAEVEQHLAEAPPVVGVSETAELKQALARAAEGGAFLLQAGDCAESFADFSLERVRSNHRLLLDLGRLIPGEVVHVARAAGQFAKPRSAAVEAGESGPIPTYRGDAVNGVEASPAARRPDPQRLLRAHSQSLATAKMLDAFASEGALNGPGPRVYASHEALLLNYEQALTRRDERTGRCWATSAHMVWIGERTRGLDGAHVEYARGIANPIGLKCGPGLRADDLLRLIDRLDPANEAGRLVLIGRFGAEEIGRTLPHLMRAARAEGRKVLWVSDPMHGNGRVVNGRKTRLIDEITTEIRHYFDIAAAEGVHAGGLHLETTAAPVTECIGGRSGLSPADLSRRYESLCDPRLNGEQSIEVAAFAADCMSGPALQRERAA